MPINTKIRTHLLVSCCLLMTILVYSCFPEPNDHAAQDVQLICEPDTSMNKEAVFVLAYDDQVKLGHLPNCQATTDNPLIKQLRQQTNYINEQFYEDSLLLAGYYLIHPTVDCLSVYQILEWKQGPENERQLIHQQVGTLQPGHSNIQLPTSINELTGLYLSETDTIRLSASKQQGAVLVAYQDSIARHWRYNASFGIAYGPEGEVAWVKNGAVHILGTTSEVYKKTNTPNER